MSRGTQIQWATATWNPLVGCTKVSAGCANCYAMRTARRMAGIADATVRKGGTPSPKMAAYRAVVKRDGDGIPLPQWNNTVVTVEEVLDEPLRWKDHERVFVDSCSDLFHEKVPFEFVDKVFAVMNATTTRLPIPQDVTKARPWHTYLVLTKRPERMAEYMVSRAGKFRLGQHPLFQVRDIFRGYGLDVMNASACLQWPPPNVWLGTSCEDQETADERIPHLLRCPAAVRFLSMEPMLGPVDLSAFFGGAYVGLPGDKVHNSYNFGVDWVICGGESGKGARPFDLAWARSVRDQCRSAGVPFFLKQLGRRPVLSDGEGPIGEVTEMYAGGPKRMRLALELDFFKDPHGGDESEWPEDLRGCRAFPACAEVAA